MIYATLTFFRHAFRCRHTFSAAIFATLIALRHTLLLPASPFSLFSPLYADASADAARCLLSDDISPLFRLFITPLRFFFTPLYDYVAFSFRCRCASPPSL